MGRGSHQITAFTMTILTVTLIVLSFFNTTVSAGKASISGTITDEKTKEPIVNATVTIYYYENITEVTTTKTDSNGYYKISELSSGDYLVKIQANEYRNESIKIKLKTDQFGVSDTYELNVHLSPISDNGGGGNVSWVTFLLGFFQIGIIITILMVISLVMYSKIKRENLLKNAVRKQIFEYIKENPGIHYRAILNGLDLPIGVLSYHLNRLEKAQFVKSRQDGMFRRFYMRGPKTEVQFFLSEIQESILNVIKKNLGISQSKIGEKINVSRKVVNYHVNILSQAGLIFVETRGRETACYPIELKTRPVEIE
ncbi:MAG: hypothetical protein A7315_06765 [Candidatus Altiarchaeales archaeon WOR_SM1_79]|nr:MAG: hypothetical protein A7315_06765 [Candidatus Altiarchaeales archaeon WOR_SM1_79]